MNNYFAQKKVFIIKNFAIKRLLLWIIQFMRKNNYIPNNQKRRVQNDKVVKYQEYIVESDVEAKTITIERKRNPPPSPQNENNAIKKKRKKIILIIIAIIIRITIIS